jgi:hypothetical protein
MKWVTLVLWVLTAGGGFVLLGLWLKHGGMRESELPGDRIRSARILSHFALAAAGLVLWIVYVATDTDGLAWVAFGVLAVVAVIGFSMLAIWVRQGARQPALAGGGTAEVPAERHFPTLLVAGHGVLAATTLVLALLTAAGVGS